MWLSAHAENFRVRDNNEFVALQAWVPSGVTLVVVRGVPKTVKPVVKELVLNQTRGYWMLNNALFIAFTIYMRSMIGRVRGWRLTILM